MFLLPIAAMNLLWLYPMGTSWFVGGLCMLSLLLPIYALRNCGLVVHTREGQKLRWYLDTMWPNTRKWRALDEAWAVAAQALALRGISVQDSKG